MSEYLKILEDKLDHARESMNFVAGELLKYKQCERAQFHCGERVIQWEVDYYYRVGDILEIEKHGKDMSYYIRWKRSTLTGVYECAKESWSSEDRLFGTISGLKIWLKDRIEKLVSTP